MATRCRSPPDSWSGYRERKSAPSDTSASARAARSDRSRYAQPQVLLQRLGDDLADGLARVERGVAGSGRRTAPAAGPAAAGPGRPRPARAPSNVMSPVQLLCRPTMQRASVVFPEPDSPTTATHDSAGTSRSMPDSTVLAPVAGRYASAPTGPRTSPPDAAATAEGGGRTACGRPDLCHPDAPDGAGVDRDGRGLTATGTRRSRSRSGRERTAGGRRPGRGGWPSIPVSLAATQRRGHGGRAARACRVQRVAEHPGRRADLDDPARRT